MASLVLSPLLQVVLDRLASQVVEQLQNFCDLRENFNKLQQSVRGIQLLLDDAEGGEQISNAEKIWRGTVKDMVYDADDLLDELTREISRCERSNSIGCQVRRLLPFEPSKHLFEIARELSDLLGTLKEVPRESVHFNLKEKRHNRHFETSVGRGETSSAVITSKVLGRMEDKEEIIKLLHRPSNEENTVDVPIISIVGIGGIGKTTLAKLVYDDYNLMRCFDVKMWVHVSNDFNLNKIISVMIESASERCESTVLEILQRKLQECLHEKTYLLVLDDVWEEDQSKWEELQHILGVGKQGSKIIVTTRIDKVASILRTPYHLKGLAEEHCRTLFKSRAFGPGEVEKHPNLVAVGEQIVKKCGGVPLAALTLGGALNHTKEEGEWLFVKDSDLCQVDNRESGILPTLRLSYSSLPTRLKQCFAYCSLFPKSYDFKKEKIIHLWMAEGLIPASGGHRPPEDIGNGYFNSLLSMSFFQEVEDSEDESMKVYRMHDLIHDLAQSVAGSEFLRLEHVTMPSNLARTRHSSIVFNFQSSTIPPALQGAKRIRTLLLMSPGVSAWELPSPLPTKFKFLRVLDISGCGIKMFQKSNGALLHLRYLDLSNTSIQELPDTICDLLFLQTLNLSGCRQLLTLPRCMGKLINLRHLNISKCVGLTRIPPRIGKLVYLQTLPIYIVGEDEGESITELSCLNLKGELTIKCLENVRDKEEARTANLKAKQLHVLELCWGDDVGNVRLANDSGTIQSTGSSRGDAIDALREEDSILEYLEPHPNLKKLSIKGYPGITFPNWPLRSVTRVELINLRRCKALPTFGQLPFLKSLHLQAMEGIECIGQDFYGRDIQVSFPSLKELTLIHFPRLTKWSGSNGEQVFSCLEKLIVRNCPNLTSAPAPPSLQHLELKCCNPLLIVSMENLTSLSILVIDTFNDLLLLPGDILINNTHLTSLKISSCPNLLSLPSQIENLTALKSLTIGWCEQLKSWPQELQNLTSLESLEITECHGINSLPEGIQSLISLKTLSIENCDHFSLLPGLQYPSALEYLTIMFCPKLTSLPDGLHKLSALRSLSILSCPNLVSLPMDLPNVNTLQTLEIRSCSSLQRFPEWDNSSSSLRSLTVSDCEKLTSLPEGVLRLSTIKHLSYQ